MIIIWYVQCKLGTTCDSTNERPRKCYNTKKIRLAVLQSGTGNLHMIIVQFRSTCTYENFILLEMVLIFSSFFSTVMFSNSNHTIVMGLQHLLVDLIFSNTFASQANHMTPMIWVSLN